MHGKQLYLLVSPSDLMMLLLWTNSIPVVWCVLTQRSAGKSVYSAQRLYMPINYDLKPIQAPGVSTLKGCDMPTRCWVHMQPEKWQVAGRLMQKQSLVKSCRSADRM